MDSRDLGASDGNTPGEAELSQEPEVFRKATPGGITGSKCRTQYGKRKNLTAEHPRRPDALHTERSDKCRQSG